MYICIQIERTEQRYRDVHLSDIRRVSLCVHFHIYSCWNVDNVTVQVFELIFVICYLSQSSVMCTQRFRSDLSVGLEIWITSSASVVHDDPGVCLSVGHARARCAKKDERIDVLFAVETPADPRIIVLDGSPHPPQWSGWCSMRKTVVQAFVSLRLDYCNSLLSGVTDSLVQRLQAVQNAGARLVTGIRRCEHITPVLSQLHWLAVSQRIEFKMVILVYAPVWVLGLE